ncbi:ATP-dependent 6-phosphofructokinase [Pseudoalteromonas sp. BDTF-M6]|uniref:ATP-dependent 6-phosphofructokinase n=1 Tax=Pseudoalteromonas sp. BDTF-M6 TaxID=2796132 RepID=UPI001BB01226|nr:ATP-dependent 6-phosphofructokinase [Pseudoalteromonas sp. BDTF-M6]MBS3796780.1 6-phosphofructokinase [Pseudoalteromonas sp. BDTF-M6]
MSKQKRIAMITSGGDAPGMNSAIRAITLKALSCNYQVIGYHGGYNGLIDENYTELGAHQVNDIIHRGGTIIKSARCPAMHTESGILQAANSLRKCHVDALIVIGGDGSFKGAEALSAHWSGQIIGIPGTIDNDINGTDATIGFYTAIDTALGCIDKIRDTAQAFERTFVVEVMGRDCGIIAMEAGLASGAEQIICKELIDDEQQFIAQLKQDVALSLAQDAAHSYVLVMAEHSLSISAQELAEQLSDFTGVDSRSAILGYVQRGGAPVAGDRILATQLGVEAVKQIELGNTGIMVGIENAQVTTTALSDTSDTQARNVNFVARLKEYRL